MQCTIPQIKGKPLRSVFLLLLWSMFGWIEQTWIEVFWWSSCFFWGALFWESLQCLVLNIWWSLLFYDIAIFSKSLQYYLKGQSNYKRQGPWRHVLSSVATRSSTSSYFKNTVPKRPWNCLSSITKDKVIWEVKSTTASTVFRLSKSMLSFAFLIKSIH